MHVGLFLLFSAVLLCGTYGRAVWWNKYATDSESQELQYAWPPRHSKNEREEHSKPKSDSGDAHKSLGTADFERGMPWEQLEAHLAGSEFLRDEGPHRMPTSFDIESLFKPQPDEGWQWEDPDFQDWDKPSSQKRKKDVTSADQEEKQRPKQRQRFFWLDEKPRPKNGLAQKRRVWVVESRGWENPAGQNRNGTATAKQSKRKLAKEDRAKAKKAKIEKAPLRSAAGKGKHDRKDSSSLSNEGRQRTTAQDEA